jgi:high-affinity Fe2+/Pb2+ permease
LRKFSVIQVVLLLVASAGIGFGIVYGAWKLGMLEGSPMNLVYMALVSAGVFVALYLLRKSASRNS